MSSDNTKIINEEQEVLNDLIEVMDKELKNINQKEALEKIKARTSRTMTVPEAYADLIVANNSVHSIVERKNAIMEARDELYQARIVVESDYYGLKEDMDLKIGLHTFRDKDKNIFVYNWKLPLCRHYLLDNASEKFTSKVEQKGQVYTTEYKLKLKRKIDLYFDEVMNATHLFPFVTEEGEKIIADEFLKELLKRRSEKEFKNIVFSIQRHQGKIIQAPFRENMIVQGCAGSGKSMIMLHRLPIIIYDNPNYLNKNNLYIITPSTAYIQMANQMRKDLEIADIEMGTLNQYYDYCLQKYGKEKAKYGRIDSSKKLRREDESYIYSYTFVSEIKKRFYEELNKYIIDFDNELKFFNITLDNQYNYQGKSYREELIRFINDSQKVLSANGSNLKGYFISIRSVYSELVNLERMLNTRKESILRSLRRKVEEERKVILETQKEIDKLDAEKNEVAISNRKIKIQESRSKIDEYATASELVQIDDEYFKSLEVLRVRLNYVMNSYLDNFNIELEQNSSEQIYKWIDNRKYIFHEVMELISDLKSVQDMYEQYVDSFEMQTRENERTLKNMATARYDILSFERSKEIHSANKNASELRENIVDKIYLQVMSTLGCEPDDKGKMKVYDCAPFVYLLIQYCFQGSPNTGKESLITIDEAQNVAPVEIQLIRKINDDKVVLNLFGDEKQHVEGTKGIDQWSDLANIVEFKQYNMNENYRNAEQITKFCNDRFGMKMRAINLPGNGYHVLTNYNDFVAKTSDILSRALKQGISAIIVKDEKEVAYFLKKFAQFKAKINNMLEETNINKAKWNLLTVTQSKGLEFETVIVTSGAMTKNEQYIAYTRALDELYLFEGNIPEDEIINISLLKKGNETKNISTQSREKKEKAKSIQNDFSNSEVRQFFEEKGLEVKDLRSERGFLWVVGEKNEIEKYVDEAVKKFGIMGGYSASKAIGFKNGWYTKTKK